MSTVWITKRDEREVVVSVKPLSRNSGTYFLFLRGIFQQFAQKVFSQNELALRSHASIFLLGFGIGLSEKKNALSDECGVAPR